MRRPRLASVFALRLAVTLGVAMAAYAALEINRDPALPRWGLAVTHAWHVAALGVLLYAILLVGVERTIAAPLRKIHAHLYRVATGRLEILELASSVREVEEIVGSVNLMVRRMRIGSGEFDARRAAASLRDVARRLHAEAPEDAEAVLAGAAALEAAPAASGGRSAALEPSEAS